MRHTLAERSTRRGVIKIEPAIRGVVRIERQAKQTLFAAIGDLGGNIEIGRRIDGARRQVDEVNLSSLLHNEKAAGVAWRRGDIKRRGESARDPLRVESRSS